MRRDKLFGGVGLLWRDHQRSSLPSSLAVYDFEMSLTVVEGDPLDEPVDVIVNAWNRDVIPARSA
jgi:hypothetical protein